MNGAPTVFEESISQQVSFSQGCLFNRLNPDSPTPIRCEMSRFSSSRMKSMASWDILGSLGNSTGSEMIDFCRSSLDLALKGLYKHCNCQVSILSSNLNGSTHILGRTRVHIRLSPVTTNLPSKNILVSSRSLVKCKQDFPQ